MASFRVRGPDAHDDCGSGGSRLCCVGQQGRGCGSPAPFFFDRFSQRSTPVSSTGLNERGGRVPGVVPRPPQYTTTKGKDMDLRQAITYTLITLFISAAAAVVVYFIASGVMHGDALNSEVKKACIDAGGSWVDYGMTCFKGSGS